MKSVLIGMSGGVDSSVAAAILAEEGYKVIGASMLLWDGNDMTGEAEKVCRDLGIEFRKLDFRDIFREKVVEYFITEYKSGRTPNPCIMCNKYLKFGAMFDYAVKEGIDYVATGHYAKIEFDKCKNEYILRVSDAVRKDQSYVLYNFTQEQLSRTIMPLGVYDKDQVRKMAQDMGLEAANKPDSQEICFVPDDDYASFIQNYSGYKPEEGNILDIQGNIIGRHRGIIFYTIGQRKGIGAYGRPMFVMKMDKNANTITLGEKGMEYSRYLDASEVNFISGIEPQEPIHVKVKIRYMAAPANATVTVTGKKRVRVDFDEPQRAVTPGQAVVFYDSDRVVGGGIVE